MPLPKRLPGKTTIGFAKTGYWAHPMRSLKIQERKKEMKITRSMKNAGANLIMENVAGHVGRYLATLSPESAKKLLSTPGNLLGIKIPGEFLGSLAGSAGGLAVVEIAKRFIPGFSDDIADHVQDFVGMVADEYEEAVSLKHAHGGAEAPSGARRVTMKNLYLVSRRVPAVAVLSRCPLRHQLKDDGSANPDFHPVEIEDIALGGLHAPSNPDEGWKEGCICERVLKTDLEPPQGVSAKAEPAPKATAPRSLADIIGGEIASGDEERKRAAISLRNLLATAHLNPAEIFLAENADTANEYQLLASCKTREELRGVLPFFQAKAERGIVGGLGVQVQLAFARGREIVEKYHAVSKKWGDEQARRLAVLRLCRQGGVKREEVFWALKPGISDLKSVDDLTEEHVLFALSIPRDGIESPIDAYRKNRKPVKQEQKPASPKKGWIARFFGRA